MSDANDVNSAPQQSNGEPTKHVKVTEPGIMFFGLLITVASAIICMQIISRVGFTPNTSIIGAILAMSLARIPIGMFKKYRSIDRQNLMQTMASTGGFAAANCGLLAVAIFYSFGDTSLIVPMLLGSAIAMMISVTLVYNLFDSELFPASGTWPPGVATAQALRAGDEGGKKALHLLLSVIIGAIGSSRLFVVPAIGLNGLPMAGLGIAFIANVFAMIALGLGLIIRGYFPAISAALSPLASSFGFELPTNLGTTYLPQGFMIGAGAISLIQALAIIFRKRTPQADGTHSVSTASVKKTLKVHFALFAAGALALALISGIVTQMSIPMLALWLLWCTFSAIVAPILVGLSAMHSGWFPGFAVSIIFLIFGVFMGFPPHALVLLTGYVASTGPCFADMGYDLKTGWLLRGKGANMAYEKDGRRQQMLTELIGGVVAFVTVGLLMNMHFQLDLIPPVSRVFATTIQAGLQPSILPQLMWGAVFGGLLQLIGGAKKALGILFATGLLINNPIYGVGLLIALLIRFPLQKKYKAELELYGGGFIAGDGLYGFFNALIRVLA